MSLVVRLVLLSLILLLGACGKEPLYQEQAYVFGTQVDVSIYGEDEAKARQAVASVMHEFQRLHDLLHAWKPSELSALNVAFAHGKSKVVSSEVASMLQDAAKMSFQSGGLFNPAIGGLIQTWGFQADDFKSVLPDEKKVGALVKANPQMSDIVFLPSAPIEQKAVSLPPHAGKLEEGKGVLISSHNSAVQIDLGGYAKGYALDRAAAILKQQGINNALINIGGNVLALGKHGSRAWRVGIQHPRKPGPIATLELRDGEAIGTSGDYQRYFEINGKRYFHLIDPRSGYPADGTEAVTILTHGERAGLLSDGPSKPIFIAGTQGWRSAAKQMQISEAMLIDADGVVHLTAELRKRLEFTDKSTVSKVEP